MKRSLSVFYIFLLLIPYFSYAMTFNKKLLSTNMNKFSQEISQATIIDDKIQSPESISICGQTIDCKNKTLEQVYKEIQDSDTNEDYTAFMNIITPENKPPKDYLQAINNAILLSAATAWSPDEYAGKTPQQIIDYMKKSQQLIYQNDKMFSSNPDIQNMMPEYIKNKVIELRATDLKSSSGSSLRPTASTTSSSVKVVSDSEKANEWTFVFKAVYEKLLIAGTTALVNVLSNENKNIGPQAQAILRTSIQNNKTYVEYLQDLLSAVRPMDIKISSDVVSAPETINLNRKDEEIVGKNSKELYDLVMSERGDKFALIKNLEKNLQPNQVKQDFMALYVENSYCMDQKIKIQKTINLFTPQVAKNTIAPISFGDAWFKKPIEFKGFSQDITIDSSSHEWTNAIDKLKDCFKSTIASGGLYSLIPAVKMHEVDDVSLYADEQKALHVKAIQDKVTSIIEFMKKNNFYPAPMDVFDQAWNALYVKDNSDTYKYATYKSPTNQKLNVLQDPEDVDVVKQALLDSFVAMPYVEGSKVEIGGASQVEASVATLPDDLAQKMSDYATQGKIKISSSYISSIIAGVQLPEGWNFGMAGLNSPAGLISNADIIKVVKSKSDQGDEAGTMSEGHYNLLLKYKAELDPKDNSPATAALRAGSTYKEYKDILAGGASQAIINITKEGYDDLLTKVQVEMKKKGKSSLVQIKLNFTTTEDYKKLKLPADYADVLFPALMSNSSYEKFISSAEYKQYLEDNKVTATPAAVPAKAAQATKIAPSNILVDKAKYDELLTRSDSSRFRGADKKPAGIRVGLFPSVGFDDTVLTEDKDKLAQALFDKKTFDEYVTLCGGEPAQAAPAKAAQATKIAPSNILVDKIQYDELLSTVTSKKAVNPKLSVMAVKTSLATITDKANNEEQFGLDKSKLAQALLDGKTFDEYVALCGGEPAQAAPTTADKAASKLATPPATQKPSVVQGEATKASGEQIVNDAKIFDDFKKSIKISNLLFMEVAKDQLARS